MVLITAPRCFHRNLEDFAEFKELLIFLFFPLSFQTATTIKVTETTTNKTDKDMVDISRTEEAEMTAKAGSATTRRRTTISKVVIVNNHEMVISKDSLTKEARHNPTTRATVHNNKATLREAAVEATSNGKLSVEASTTNEEAIRVNNQTAEAINASTRRMISSSPALARTLTRCPAHQAIATVEVTVAINQLKNDFS